MNLLIAAIVLIVAALLYKCGVGLITPLFVPCPDFSRPPNMLENLIKGFSIAYSMSGWKSFVFWGRWLPILVTVASAAGFFVSGHLSEAVFLVIFVLLNLLYATVAQFFGPVLMEAMGFGDARTMGGAFVRAIGKALMTGLLIELWAKTQAIGFVQQFC